MIDVASIGLIVVGCFGCWASGFVVGKTVAWVRAIRDFA